MDNDKESITWIIKDMGIVDIILFAIIHIFLTLVLISVSCVIFKYYGMDLIFKTIKIFSNYNEYGLNIMIPDMVLMVVLVYIQFELFKCIFIWCSRLHLLILCRIKIYMNVKSGDITYDDDHLKEVLLSQGDIIKDETIK